MTDLPARSENTLPAGLTMDQLQTAIEKSGYPLQIDVANMLRARFRIQPEWGFSDRNTGDMRAIDIMATRDLFARETNPEVKVRPHLVLLIECKRSDMPYVFFKDKAGPLGDFPHVAGLKHERLSLRTDSNRNIYGMPFLRALGLNDHVFLDDKDITCSTLSKAARKGPHIELSGTDAYQNLVQPLRSAVEHFRTTAMPPPRAAFFDAYLVIGLAILDSPMVSATQGRPSGTTAMEPWQRLWRHEPLEPGTFGAQFGRSSAIDIVHRSYLPTYIDKHLMPFADEFGERVVRHGAELSSGEGFVDGPIFGMSSTDLEAHLTHRD